jgi:FkbM family methyltransferase
MPSIKTIARTAISTLRGSRIHSARAVTNRPMVSIGTAYGAHTVATEGLSAASVVYSFGIGEDASFDLGLIERFGCRVYAFDPTPRSAEWARQNITDSRFLFSALGLAAENGELEVTAPENPAHVSFSFPNGRPPSDRFTMRRLSTILAANSHTHIDVLKMDIEGFEYAALRDMILSNVVPTQLLVEFHHGMYGHTKRDTRDTVNLLLSSGYAMFHVSPGGHEYSFINRAR